MIMFVSLHYFIVAHAEVRGL